MELVPAGIELSFEVTYDRNDLNVGMTVYDTSGASPVLVMAPTAMEIIYGNTYVGKFSPSAQKNYLIIKSVYTDGSLTVLDSGYASGSESIVAEILGAFGQVSGGCAVVGIVVDNNPVIGVVEC